MSEETKKVYVITSGEYSDYGIEMICDTREIAEKAMEIYHYNSNNSAYIEEWDLNVRKPEDIIPNWIFWYDMEKNEIKTLRRHSFHQFSNYIPTKKELGGTVFAENEEKAKKIIYDLVAKKKAELAEIV